MKATVSPSAPTICVGSSTTTLIANGASAYNWSPSTGLNVTAGNVVTAHPTNSTIYIVTGSYSNGCPTKSTPVSVTIKVLLGDFDRNGYVSVSDLLSQLSKFNSDCTCPEDINNDGSVNNTDFLIFISEFGKNCL